MTHPITRHFIDIASETGTRRVHYRKCGNGGPTILMVHQSPRSSGEYEPLMQQWAQHFRWNEDATNVEGVTATGRATVAALQLNRPSLVNMRRVLRASGDHPPE